MTDFNSERGAFWLMVHFGSEVILGTVAACSLQVRRQPGVSAKEEVDLSVAFRHGVHCLYHWV